MNNSTRFRPRCHKPCNTWRSRRASAGSPAGCAGFARPEGVRPHLPFPRRSDPQGHVDRSALHPLLTQHLEKQSIQLDQGQLLRQGPLPELRCRLQDLVGEEQPRHLRRLALRGRWPPPPRPPVGLEQAGAAPPGGWSAPPGQKRSPASFAASVFLQESLPVSVQQNLQNLGRGFPQNHPQGTSLFYTCLRVLPHSSTPAILSKTRLRMRLWTKRIRFTRAARPQKDQASMR